jgi:amidohydrolase
LEQFIHKIKELANQNIGFTQSIREQIHAHPELSFKEYLTSDYIAQQLNELQIPYTKMAGTGIVATIEGVNPNIKTIALRSELDALPITEKNTAGYVSTNVGVMHACGHDVHTACLLGAAKILKALAAQWQGTIKLVIQPGEEKEPGGASVMLKEGLLKDHAISQITALHVHPSMQVGKVGFRGGLYMASADEIYITVKGKGGHGALPQGCIDTVLIASHIIVALQQVVSRNAYPIIPTVLSFGKIIGNGATNVIPDEVKIEGTLRTMDEIWRKAAHNYIKRIAEHTAIAMGGICEVSISKGYPCLTNNPELTTLLKNGAQEYLGTANVEDLDLRMTAEDFSFFAQEIPACFFRLGTASINGNNSAAVHSSNFDIDAGAYEVGAGLMAYLALKQLSLI